MTKTASAAAFTGLLVASQFCFAQQPKDAVDEYMKAGSAYRACVVKYAERFANTPESPSDIASAALSACSAEIAAFHLAVLSIPEFAKNDLAILENFSTGNRNEAIKTVLEKRYPGK